jgi:cytochrome c553
MKTISQILIVVATYSMIGTFMVSDANAQSLPELDRSLLFPSNADIAEGASLADDACASCHGLDGVSIDPALPHVAGQHVIYLYDELTAYKEGRRTDESMAKAVQFLSDDALRKVSVYYASLMPPGVVANSDTGDGPQASPDPVQLGEAAAAACAGCHGANGNSQIPGMPSLTAQSPEYFVVSMQAYKSGGRRGNMMAGMASAIDDESIQNMALYYALQEPQGTALSGGGDAGAGSTVAQPCSSCHGADGNTAGVDMPTLAGQDAVYLAASMKAYANGQRDHAQMVTATTELDDVQIEDLAAFYAEQEPSARDVRRPPTTAEWIERCDRCHGIGGNSTNPRYPSLASQHKTYLARVIEDYVNGKRQNSTMSAMSRPLRPADIEALAAYYAAQQRKSILYVDLPCAPDNNQ